MESKEYKDLIAFIAETLGINRDEVTIDENLNKIMVAAENWADQLGEFVFENKEAFNNAENAIDAFYESCID